MLPIAGQRDDLTSRKENKSSRLFWLYGQPPNSASGATAVSVSSGGENNRHVMTIQDPATLHREALALHRSGSVAEAAQIYDAILLKDPGNKDVLGLAALARHRLGDFDSARDNWLKSVAQPAEAKVLLRNLNNLLAAILNDGLTVEPQFLDDVSVPEWPPGPSPDNQERAMILSLARALSQTGRDLDGVRLLESTASRLEGDFNFNANAADIMAEAGHVERASLLLNSVETSECDKANGVLIAKVAMIFASGNLDEARRQTQKTVEAIPIYLTAAAPGQAMLIGVLNPAPKLIQKWTSPKNLHFADNFPANLAWTYNDAYRFLSMFPEASTVRAALENVPRPAVILNNWINGEVLSTPGALEFISEFADSLSLPVLNHPGDAAQTTRQRNAEKLSATPNLVVPRIRRYLNREGESASIARAVRNEIGFPVIIRNPFAQMGRKAARLDTPRQLKRHLDQTPDQQLYAIEYIHNPVANGIFRKIRAIVIGGEIFVSHVKFAQSWNVHMEWHQKFKLESHITQFAEMVVADPAKAIGKVGMQALDGIGRSIPLDFYGIDFDLMPDGRLLFFEANAAMNLSLSGRRISVETREQMREAFRRLLRKAQARHGRDE